MTASESNLGINNLENPLPFPSLPQVVLKNVVIKLRTSRHVLTATCQSIDLVTTPLGQQPQSDAQDPEEWIYKTLEINGLTASISEATPGSVGGSRLARVPKASLRVAVPWPAGVMGLQEGELGPGIRSLLNSAFLFV